MKILKTVLTLLFLLPLVAQAQDPEFTQTMANPMYFNPAFAGIQQNLRSGLQYRSQWGGAFSSTLLSADLGLPKINGGVGIMAMHDADAFGIMSTNSFSGLFAYEIKLATTSYLRFGVAGSITQRNVNLSGLRFGSSIDPKGGFSPDTTPMPNISIIDPNMAVGALFYTNGFYGGFSVYNMFQRKSPLGIFMPQFLTQRFDAQAGGFIKFDEFTINPNLLMMRQGDFTQFLPGINFSNGMFTVGTSFRFSASNADAINFMVGFAKGKFKVCYSYDHTVSDLRKIRGFEGSHELSLVFQLSRSYEASDKPMIGYLRNAF
jgi:type IX secretion system PorP/SprF family membrane protein